MKVNISARLLPKQIEYVESTSDIAVYTGGVGAGKTIANVTLAIRLAIQHPGIDILVCCPTYGMLKDTILFEFMARCPGVLLNQKRTALRGIYPVATFVPIMGRESTIRFRAFDTPGKPKGITVGTAIIDEVTETDQKVLGEIIRRVRQDGMPNYIRLSTNPDSKLHYVYQQYIEPADLGLLPKNRLHKIHTTSYDNYLLPASYMRNLEQLKVTQPGEYLRMVMGEWGDFDEEAIGAFPKIPAFTSPYLVAFLDTSFSDSTVSDRTALSVVGFVPQNSKASQFWPIEFTGKAWQKSITNTDVIREMILFLDRFKPVEVCVESQLGDSTQIFIDRFREMERSLGVSPKNHWTVLHQTKNKHERIMLEVAGNKDRMSVLEDTEPSYLNPVVSYKKKIKHEDEIDSLAGAIDRWRNSPVLREYIRLTERRAV